jgi:hypothetical protein
MKTKQQKSKLNESLRPKDLKNCVNEVFTVDRYESKMGEDQDVVVLGFRVKEKHPAIDLVEFIERGYNFVLDADMSTGEEHDGQYQVFVELERTPKLPQQLQDLLRGVSELTDNRHWKFRYQKANHSVEFTEEAVMETIPTTPAEYHSKILEIKTTDVQEFFDQGTVDVALESNNTLTFSKLYSGDVDATFVAIGEYDNVKETLPGPLALDESSQSQVTFLNKYLGNYDINKVGDKFLIRNGTRAVVIQKNRW